MTLEPEQLAEGAVYKDDIVSSVIADIQESREAGGLSKYLIHSGHQRGKSRWG